MKGNKTYNVCKINGKCEHGIDYCFNCVELVPYRYQVHKINKRYGTYYGVYDVKTDKYLNVCKNIANAHTIIEILKADEKRQNYIERILRNEN